MKQARRTIATHSPTAISTAGLSGAISVAAPGAHAGPIHVTNLSRRTRTAVTTALNTATGARPVDTRVDREQPKQRLHPAALPKGRAVDGHLHIKRTVDEHVALAFPVHGNTAAVGLGRRWDVQESQKDERKENAMHRSSIGEVTRRARFAARRSWSRRRSAAPGAR